MPLSGTLTLKKNYHRGVGGDISFSGEVSTGDGFTQDVAGLLSFSGGVVAYLKNKHQDVVGGLSFNGNLGSISKRFLTVGGVLSFSGALTAFAGFINVYGILGVLSGALSLKKNGVPVGVGNIFAITRRGFRRVFTQWRQ